MSKRGRKQRSRQKKSGKPAAREPKHELLPSSHSAIPGPESQGVTAARPPGLARMVPVFLAFLAGVGAYWLLEIFWSNSNLPSPKLFELQISGEVPSGKSAVIAPDGGTIAYVSDGRLWVRKLRHTDAMVVPGSEGAIQPFWSPGSDSIGFFNRQSGDLFTASTAGGMAVIRCSLPVRGVFGGASWGVSGSIVFSQDPQGLFLLPSDSSDPLLLADVEAALGDAGLYAPYVLPDGKTVLFASWKNDGLWQIELLRDKERETVLTAAAGEIVTAPIHTPSGFLMYNRVHSGGQGVWGVRYNPSEAVVSGEPFEVADGAGWPSTSSDDLLIYTRTDHRVRRQLTWISRDGKTLGQTGPLQDMIGPPTLSPDDRTVAAAAMVDDRWDIWTYDVARGEQKRLTFDAAHDSAPVWSPDGNRIAYVSERGDSAELRIISPNDTDQNEVVLTTTDGDLAPTWSGDGYNLGYQHSSADTGSMDIWSIALEAETEPIRLLESDANEAMPQLSPDGRYMAYQSDETGEWQVYVVPFPTGGKPHRVSSRGGRQPKWSYWSEELFYLRGNEMMASPIRTGGSFRILGPPVRLFRRDFEAYGPTEPAYDVTSDGQRFIMVGNDVNTTVTSILIVQDWYP